MTKRTAARPINPNAITGFEKLHNPDSRMIRGEYNAKKQNHSQRN
ncbi:hypothetical protein LCGC14_2247230 [marine sediment metagenome]|uniref:Uncharacterized protein n=1 Tax=marine sediment metagenome TaxID=412755 RepID=A0A0F9FYR4_9ZZZZ